ncbi:hypothetical protein HD806DRAFT_508500, partial [Xylariaceae sp. AK1471]
MHLILSYLVCLTGLTASRFFWSKLIFIRHMPLSLIEYSCLIRLESSSGTKMVGICWHGLVFQFLPVIQQNNDYFSPYMKT